MTNVESKGTCSHMCWQCNYQVPQEYSTALISGKENKDIEKYELCQPSVSYLVIEQNKQ